MEIEKPVSESEIEDARRHADECCVVREGHLMEQTCEAPDGPCTHVCNLLHLAIESQAILARRLLAERDALEIARTKQEGDKIAEAILRHKAEDRIAALEQALAGAHVRGCECHDLKDHRQKGTCPGSYDDPCCLALRAGKEPHD